VDQIDSLRLKKVRKNTREYLRINDSIDIIISRCVTFLSYVISKQRQYDTDTIIKSCGIETQESAMIVEARPACGQHADRSVTIWSRQYFFREQTTSLACSSHRSSLFLSLSLSWMQDKTIGLCPSSGTL